MKAELHPEYKIEAEHLEEVLGYVSGKIDEWSGKPFSAADNASARKVREVMLATLANFREAQKEPFFGRVDWRRQEDGAIDSFYIGKKAVPERNVYAWQETTVADIYYQGYSDKEDGTLLLKRTLDLNVPHIRDITDDSKHALRDQLLGGLVVSNVSVLDTVQHSDEYLRQILQAPHSGQLGEVVASIQETQYQVIKEPLKQTLVLQGAPGTGKTIVALHRIAFLLYNSRNEKDFDRSRVIFFTPNPIFSQYVSRVLPELSERGITQMTFEDWANDMTGLADRIEPDEDTLEALLGDSMPLSHKIMRMRNARNKGSLEMARLLDNYCVHLRAEMLEKVQGIELTQRNLPRSIGDRLENWSLRIAPTEVVDVIRSTAGWENIPVNRLKERIADALARQLMIRPEIERLVSIRSSDDDRVAVRSLVGRAATRALAEWKEQNLSVAWRRLLRSSTLLMELGSGLFSDTDLSMMNLDAPRQGLPLRASDVAGLAYLHGRLNGIDPKGQFDLVVIDEAQDLSLLQFIVIKQWSRNQAFTIVGDVAQSINPYRGLNSWQELTDVLDNVKITELTESYRSTSQIVSYAETLCKRMGSLSKEAHRRFVRNGESISEIACVDDVERLNVIAERLVELAEIGGSIGLIAKSAEVCREFARGLDDFDFVSAGAHQPLLADERNQNIEAPCVILPAYLAKGLEFDHVLVVDADEFTYTENALDAGLLYVALTRATSTLDVLYVGEKSKLLETRESGIAQSPLARMGIEEQLVSVAAFAQRSARSLPVDTYVERLSATGNLALLARGAMDEHLLSILSEDWVPSDGEEEVVPALSARTRAEVESKIRVIETNAEHPAQLFTLAEEGLAMLQLAYGLLRNVAGSNIDSDHANLVDAGAQACALLQLWAPLAAGKPVARGPLTSRNRALGAVQESRRELAGDYLDQLLEYGIVETVGQGRSERLGIAYPWLAPLVAHALGDREAIKMLESALVLPALSVDLSATLHDTPPSSLSGKGN